MVQGEFLILQVTVHLVAPTRQEKAAWITDISQVRRTATSCPIHLQMAPPIVNLFQCMDNVHFNGLFYNTMPTASSSTLPQCVKSDPNLFKDDVDIRFSKTFNTCKVSYGVGDILHALISVLYIVHRNSNTDDDIGVPDNLKTTPIHLLPDAWWLQITY